ncbi:MAG: RDD family protein [Rhodobacteraceae bacterium]|nr:RDD family protein [Paracoccaceae bacterium]
MTTYSNHRAPLWGLPDPDMQAEFYADIPVKRAVAWVLDTALISLTTALIVLFTAGIGLFFIGFIFLVTGFIYRVVSIANKSATLGMRVAAIEFRNHKGQRFDTGTAFLHTLGYSLSMSFVFPQVISIILMLTGARAQGLTDMILGTAAINRNAAE